LLSGIAVKAFVILYGGCLGSDVYFSLYSSRHESSFFRREQVATQQHITLYIQQSNKFECELCESAAPMMVKSASQLLYVKTKSSGKLGVFPHQNGLCTFSSFSNKKRNTMKIEHRKKENTKNK
jgi:hypothetical protein